MSVIIDKFSRTGESGGGIVHYTILTSSRRDSGIPCAPKVGLVVSWLQFKWMYCYMGVLATHMLQFT